jgi:hypothetical protein
VETDVPLQKVTNMDPIKEYVDRLFKANRKQDWAEIPIVGGHYLPKEDNVRPLKKMARAALAAREWFYENGPADIQPLPLSYSEREDLKSGGVPHILAWYARSLACRDFDISEHPPFDDYAHGVMASEHAPDFITKNEEVRRRFPPRPLKGLGPGLCWEPPKEHARTMETWCRCREREDRIRAVSAARDAGGNGVVAR